MSSHNLVHPILNDVRPLSSEGGTLLKRNKAMMTHEYQIEGMSCGNCVTTVENLLQNVPGIAKARVSLNDKAVKIDMDRHVDIERLQSALKSHPKFTIQEKRSFKSKDIVAGEEETKSFFETYKPILLVFAYILGTTIIAESYDGTITLMNWMRYFMAGFFLIFSFFKLLDIPSFAASYSSYDILAKKWFGWGFTYPFIELMLGILFLTGFQMLFTNIATFVIMGISTIGVVQSLLKRRKIRCACLGAVFNLPMSTITLTEDLLMVGMSGIMIVYYL